MDDLLRSNEYKEKMKGAKKGVVDMLVQETQGLLNVVNADLLTSLVINSG